MEVTDIETITVIGAGTMGHGIAEVAALAGYEVHLRDIEEDIVQEGYDQIEWSLDKLVEGDKLDRAERDATLERISQFVDLEEAVRDADVVIEAIVENMEIKKDVYADLDEAAPEQTLFATNTSTLSITELSEVTDRPDQFCGMHFFNPPIQMELVEVIRGQHTADETLDAIEDLVERLEKTPVRVRKDEPGFVVNRVLVPMLNEAFWLVEEDFATIEEIDSSTAYELGLPMGAFELSDQLGNDVLLDVLEYMHRVLGDSYEPSPLLERTVDAGEYGKKSGEGFYDYEDGAGAEYSPDAGREDVATRLLAVMANEVGKLLENGVAPATDVDRAVKLGAGFPDGPAKMAEDEGLRTLLAELETGRSETDHPRYDVSDGLREVAEPAGFFSGDDRSGALDFETIRLEYPEESIARIVLDRPHQMNTVTPELIDELGTALDAVEANDDVGALLLTGEGDRAFCAGANAVDIAGNPDPFAGVELAEKGQETWGRLEELDVPVVACIDGYTLGGGMELAACADLRVASDRSTFGQPEHDLGLLPGWGGTQRLKHLVGESRAKEIVFTCDHYDAETMADYGFVNEVVDDDPVEDVAMDLVEDLAAGPPLAQKYTKTAFLAGRDDTEAGLAVEALGLGHLVGSEDFLEGVSKMGSDEEPTFEGK